MKAEVNRVFRGALPPVERRPLSPRTAALFSVELEAPVPATDEPYGGKLVAAMDRQHPRDPFDVWRMHQAGGITDGAVECFVAYLAGHNRPMHEVLRPRRKDPAVEYSRGFAGMTAEPISLETLERTRDRLFDELPRRLTAELRRFLVGLARAEPRWPLLKCPHASELPAPRWKLRNLPALKAKQPDRFERQAEALESALA